MEIAARYLATRPRTRWEVQRRLLRAGAEPQVVEQTLERLGERGYVDDVAFVRWWMEQRDRHAPRGRRLVESELRQRGVSREAIESLREEWDQPERGPGADDLPGTDMERAAVALARHLRGRPVPDDPKARQRLGMFLVRRGFDPETVRATVRAAASGVDDTDDADDA
jgi:regulatory protein